LISRRAGVALAAVAVAAVAVTPVASDAKKPVRRSVKVRDYFLSPAKLKVPPRSKITFKWPKLGYEGDSHNVVLTKTHPKGVKRWHSQVANSDYHYSRRFKKKGKYVIVCSLHPDTMRLTVRVK
jgi:plastocyanin